MNIENFLERHRKTKNKIRMLKSISESKRICLGPNPDIWVEDTDIRLLGSLKNTIKEEIAVLEAEVKDLDVKIEAINTLLQE